MLLRLIGFFCLALCTVNGKCMDNCQFSQSFDSPLIIPEKCKQKDYEDLCQVEFKIDYIKRTIRVIFGSDRSEVIDRRQSNIDDNKKHDYVSEQTVINGSYLVTNLFYSCTLGERCEEVFLLEIAPKMIRREYGKMQAALVDILSASNTASTSCYTFSSPVECNGTCYHARGQLLDLNTGKLTKTLQNWPSCDYTMSSPRVIIYVEKIPMSDRVLSQRQVSFACSGKLCNGAGTADAIEAIVNQYYLPYFQ